MKSLCVGVLGVICLVGALAKADDVSNAMASHLALHHLEHLVALNKIDPSFQTMFKAMAVTAIPHSAVTDPAFKVTAEQYAAADGSKSTLETVMNSAGKALTDTPHMASGAAQGAPTWPDKDAITLAEQAQHYLLDPAQLQKPELQPFIVSLSGFTLTQIANGNGVLAQVDISSFKSDKRFRILLNTDGTVVSGNIVTVEE
jgi:hypothetical protein